MEEEVKVCNRKQANINQNKKNIWFGQTLCVGLMYMATYAHRAHKWQKTNEKNKTKKQGKIGKFTISSRSLESSKWIWTVGTRVFVCVSMCARLCALANWKNCLAHTLRERGRETERQSEWESESGHCVISVGGLLCDYMIGWFLKIYSQLRPSSRLANSTF